MKMTKRIALLLCLLAGINISLYAQRYGEGLIDKTIATVGNEFILLSQLESEVQMMMAQGYASDGNIRCSILENLMGQKLFLAQAKLDSLTASADQVEMELTNRINTAIASLGSEERLEEYFNKPLYKLRNDWRELLTEQNLTSQMQQNVMQQAGSMTPAEIEKFYKKMDKDSLPVISTQYKISQIALYPSKDEAVTAVRERLLDFRNRILNGEKFSTLATLYSQDPESVMRGGELGMAPKSIFWPAFSDAAAALKPGQISQIVETPDGFHIIQMVEKDGDMINVRHILLKPEYTSKDRDKAFKELDSIRTKILADSITFDLAAPDDLSMQNTLRSLTPEQRAMQAMNLLIYNTYNGPGTTAKAQTGNPLNAFIQKELNQWAQNSLKGVDLSFGIDSYGADDPSGEHTDYSYRLSKNLFGNRFRAVIGGKFSTDSDPSENLRENLIDDLSLEYLLTASGNMYVRIFRHTGYEILEGEITRNGVGFVIRKRMARLGDLFRSARSRTKKNETHDESDGNHARP